MSIQKLGTAHQQDLAPEHTQKTIRSFRIKNASHQVTKHHDVTGTRLPRCRKHPRDNHSLSIHGKYFTYTTDFDFFFGKLI